MVVHFIEYQCCTSKTQVKLKEHCLPVIGKLNLISNTLQLMRQQSPILLCHGCMNRQKWRMVSYLQHEIGLTIDGHTLNGTALWWFLGGDYMDSTGTGGGLYQSLVGPYYSCCLVICTLDVHCKKIYHYYTIQFIPYYLQTNQSVLHHCDKPKTNQSLQHIFETCTDYYIIDHKQIGLYNETVIDDKQINHTVHVPMQYKK